MSDTSREPCFSCAEPIALEARICPYCRQDAVVDVALEQAIGDGRQKYRLARSLVALGPPMPPLLGVQEALATARPVVASGVTRAFALRVAEVLRAESLTATVRRSSTPQGSASDQRAVWWAVGLVAGLLLLAGLWVAGRSDPTRPAVGTTAGSQDDAAPAAAVAPEPSLTTREIASRWLSSTVVLRCRNSLGSGFFVTPETVLTNAHVLCAPGEELTVITSDKRETQGFPERTDRQADLALVRVRDLTGAPIPLGDAGAVAVGEKVVMIGAPVGLDFTVHEGTVSSVSRVVEGVACLQLDAKINPGNSGGPLLDSHGRVIGIVTMKVVIAEGIGYAVPINYAYRGSPALAQPAEGLAVGDGFEAMLARAAAGVGEVTPVGAQDGVPLPMLVAASVDQYQNLVAHVVLPAPETPGYREVSFRMLVGTEELCAMKGDIKEWKPFSENAGLLEIDVKLAPAILRRSQLGQLYLGAASLRWDLCQREQLRPGIVLELDGADPELARLRLGR